MAFVIADMTQASAGGGGFYGDGRTCTLKNWRVEEHGLVKHGPDGQTVIEEFPPQCMFGVDIYAERTELDDDKFPQFVTQWYGIGQLPLARLEALGWPLARLQASILKGAGGQDQWKRRLTNPGGWQPSADGRTPSTSGPYFGCDPAEKVYDGSGWWQFISEVYGLGNATGEVVNDKVMAKGVSVLEGLVAVMGTKEMPKSKSALKKAEQAKQMGIAVEQKDARRILIPVEIVKWPWQAEGVAAGVPAPTPPQPLAAVPALAPVAAATQSAQAPVVQSPAPAPTDDASSLDKRIAAVVITLLGKPANAAGIKVGSGSVGLPVMQAFNKDPQMSAATKRSVQPAFLGGAYNGLFWNYDAANQTIKLAEGTSAEEALGMLEALG